MDSPVITNPESGRIPEKPAVVGVGTWPTLLCLVLLGYALFGKGWAYVGVPPLFVGEVTLFSGFVALILFGRWCGILQIPSAWLLLFLCAWCLGRTLPYVSLYGAETLRDAAFWGYAAF